MNTHKRSKTEKKQAEVLYLQKYKLRAITIVKPMLLFAKKPILKNPINNQWIENFIQQFQLKEYAFLALKHLLYRLDFFLPDSKKTLKSSLQNKKQYFITAREDPPNMLEIYYVDQEMYIAEYNVFIIHNGTKITIQIPGSKSRRSNDVPPEFMQSIHTLIEYMYKKNIIEHPLLYPY